MPEVSISAETVFQIGPIPVTNSMIATWLTMAVLIGLALYVRRRAGLVPNRLQGLLEWPTEYVLDIVKGADSKYGVIYFPLIGALFLFILTANWMSLLPGFGTIGVYVQHGSDRVLIPFLRAATADLNTTLAMAIVSVVVFFGFGIVVHGPVGYARTFLYGSVLDPFIALLELIGNLFRTVSLSIRLFGNIFAGEVIQIIFLSLGPAAFLVPAFFIILEVLFGLIQAAVFTLLSMTYIALAVMEHGSGHAESAAPTSGLDDGGPAEVAIPS